MTSKTTIIQSIQELIPKALLTVLVFYFIYPQALGIGGSSFILYSGIMGIAIYIYHRFPFQEVIYALSYFGAFILFTVLSGHINGVTDPFSTSYVRSQMAWFFTSYLIVFLLFKIHKNPTLETLLSYLATAIGVQCVITTLMYFNPAAKEFFKSLELGDMELSSQLQDSASTYRLVGYGSALFGAGMTCGYGLILVMYLFMKKQFNTIEFIFMAVLYTFIFYIGLFSARTTTVGLAMSLAMFGLVLLKQNVGQVSQAKKLMLSLGFLFVLGYSLAYIYFPDFTDWAFEMLNNFLSTGKLETNSSNALSGMLYAPKKVEYLLYGSGSTGFFGSDVGFTRLMFYVGIPGMILYFLIGMGIGKMAFTKDQSANYLIIVLVIYGITMNYKGLTDINMVIYLIFFYFLYYKYYVYNPKAILMYKQRTALARAKDSQKSQ